MYRRLDADAVVHTAQRLAARVAERFPDRGLTRVAAEVADVAAAVRPLAAELARPIRWARWVAAVGTGLLVAVVVGALFGLRVTWGVTTVAELVQALESLVNDVVFAGVAVWFLWSLETRLKRRRALEVLSQLRALAHVIDMHQLTKDPTGPELLDRTASSPERDLSGPLLARYLDYCSELLSLVGKVAAVVGQDLDDADTLGTVEEIEELTTGLSRKVWQKIMLIGP